MIGQFVLRLKLIDFISCADVSTQHGIADGVGGVKDWLSGSYGAVEGAFGDVVDMIKGAVGAGAIVGEEARLKGKYGNAQAESIYGTASGSATSLASQISASGYSAASAVSASAASVVGYAGSSVSSAASQASASGSSLVSSLVLEASSSASSVWSAGGASLSSV